MGDLHLCNGSNGNDFTVRMVLYGVEATGENSQSWFINTKELNGYTCHKLTQKLSSGYTSNFLLIKLYCYPISLTFITFLNDSIFFIFENNVEARAYMA